MTALSLPPGVRVLSVKDLTRSIKDLLEAEHPSVWVEGEVSNLARPSSGHVYLTLKDDEAPLKAVVYRGIALRMRFDLRDGLSVVVRGRLTVYTPRGEYQLLVEEVHPKGVGPLELAFRQLKEKLSGRGYFDPARKRPLPRIPNRIALVTSSTGSAVRDVLEVLGRRWPAVEVWVFPVRVQGDDAAPQIAAAIGYLNQLDEAAHAIPGRSASDGSRDPSLALRPGRERRNDSRIDIILLARGGGSLEDLWPFNEEVVAHAIYRSRVPVVTGIGHEDDLTIADLVADRRALTPSEAAERAVPDRLEVLATLDRSRSQLRTLLLRSLELARSRLEQLEARPCLRRPLERIREQERRMDELAERLRRAAALAVERARARLGSAVAVLEGLSPLKVLGRGYSLTRRLEDLALVLDAAQVSRGDWIITEVERGRIVSRVESAGRSAPDQEGASDE